MTTDTIGGVWTFTQELTAGLLARGCDIALVSVGRLPTAAQSRWVGAMQHTWGGRFRFEALTTNLEWMQENEDAFAGAAPALLDLASDFDAELLHLNQFCFGALATHLPKVVTAHSDVLSWWKHCRNETIENNPWLCRYRAMVSSGLARADGVTAPTRWMLNEIADNFTLPPLQFVIPNGRSVPCHSGNGRKLQAITAGRLWDEAKHVALLGEVSSPVPLLVAGESSLDDASAIHARSGVTFLGALNAENLLALFRESALYICTSIYEPFGLAPLEAALCGCAVLANDLPSLREVWNDAALYFTDADSLSALLASLAGDQELRHAAQARSWNHAQLYTSEKMAASYLLAFSQAAAVSEKNGVAHVA